MAVQLQTLRGKEAKTGVGSQDYQDSGTTELLQLTAMVEEYALQVMYTAIKG